MEIIKSLKETGIAESLIPKFNEEDLLWADNVVIRDVLYPNSQAKIRKLVRFMKTVNNEGRKKMLLYVVGRWKKKNARDRKMAKKQKVPEENYGLIEPEVVLQELVTNEDFLVNCEISDSEMEEILELSFVEKKGLTEDDLSRLDEGRKLNDKIITSYMELIIKKVMPNNKFKIMDTYFLEKYQKDGIEGIKRWIMKERLLEKEKILFPINLQNEHWLLMVVFTRTIEIIIYDSAKLPGMKLVAMIIQKLLSELASLHQMEDLNYKVTKGKATRQKNNVDCGVHLCKNARLIIEDDLSSLSEGRIVNFRRQMLQELKEGNLK